MKYIIFFAAFAAAEAAVLAVYTRLYGRRANAALAAIGKGAAGREKSLMPTPHGLLTVMLTVTAVLFTCVGVNAGRRYDTILGRRTETPIAEGGAVGSIDIGAPVFRTYTAEELNGTLLDGAPEGDLAGYARRETSDGDFRFVYYTDADSKGVFPPIFVYAEYTGSAPEGMTECAVHLDQTDWSGDVITAEGLISESDKVWFKADNIFLTGKLTLTAKNTSEGSLTIDLDEAFQSSGSSSSTAE